MKTVNSLSGGKSSSYMYLYNKADVEIFAAVCSDDHNINKDFWKKDKGLLQRVNDKLSAYADQYGEFKGTAEDPKTMVAMLELEQKAGREITWVRGDSFETVMNKRSAVPNQMMRFCTTEMKLKPIKEYCEQLGVVEMRIGFRFDEMSRIGKHFFKMSPVKKGGKVNLITDINPLLEAVTESDRMTVTKVFHLMDLVNKANSGKVQLKADLPSQFKGEEWRKVSYPLTRDQVNHKQVADTFKRLNIEFPEDSNCQMCFWKSPQQLRKNFENNPGIMNWMGIQEDLRGRTLKKEMSLLQVGKLGLQTELFFGGGAGCNAGFCTD